MKYFAYLLLLDFSGGKIKSKHKAKNATSPRRTVTNAIINPADFPIKCISVHPPKRELTITRIIIIPPADKVLMIATFLTIFLLIVMTLIINY